VRRGHHAQRLAVDLGTARTQLFVAGVGVVIDEPAVWGALRPHLVRRFGGSSGPLVRVPARPRDATARGLGGCATTTPVPA
jgi:hypothetical protein